MENENKGYKCFKCNKMWKTKEEVKACYEGDKLREAASKASPQTTQPKPLADLKSMEIFENMDRCVNIATQMCKKYSIKDEQAVGRIAVSLFISLSGKR